MTSHTEDMKGWEKEFDKEFTYGVLYSASSDLSSGEGIDWRYPKMSVEMMKDFICTLLEKKEEEHNECIEEMRELERTTAYEEAVKACLKALPGTYWTNYEFDPAYRDGWNQYHDKARTALEALISPKEM